MILGLRCSSKDYAFAVLDGKKTTPKLWTRGSGLYNCIKMFLQSLGAGDTTLALRPCLANLYGICKFLHVMISPQISPASQTLHQAGRKL